jgi:HPt (histidine-containing phosphotransfer) domain-containing protein
MTAHAMKGEAEKSLAAGMNEHITKPIDPILLYKTIFKYLFPNLDLNEIIQSNPGKTIEKDPIVLSIPGLDTQSGLQRIGNKLDSYVRLIQTFSKNYEFASSEIKNLIQQKNWVDLAAYLHTLAGVAGNIGAIRIYETAYPLSVQLKKESISENHQEEIQKIEELSSLMDHLIGEISKVNFKEEVKQVELTTEEIRLKLDELVSAIEESDPNSVDFCKELLMVNSILPENQQKLLELLPLLESFEFDEGKELLQKLGGFG